MRYCEEYAALLDLFVDGELPPGEMERVRAHLETCPGCQGYVDDALALRAGFPDVEDTVAPEGFTAGVMERVREDAGKDEKIVELKRKSTRRWLGMFAALAACCALVILVRTGSGGLSGGSNSATMAATSAGGADAPAEYAMDTGGEEEDDDAWDDLQMAMEPTASPETAKLEEGAVQIEGQSEAQMAAAIDRAAAMDTADAEEFEKAASFSEYEDLAVCPAATPPEDSTNIVYTTGSGEAALYLTSEEAGGLLDGYTPVWETVIVLDDALAGPERWYELTEEEYRSLLEALGHPAETAAAPVLVVVSGPFE